MSIRRVKRAAKETGQLHPGQPSISRSGARAEDDARVAEHIGDSNEAVPAAFAQGWLNHVREHAHQQCKMSSPRVRDVAASFPDFLRREISAAAARSAADEADPVPGTGLRKVA